MQFMFPWERTSVAAADENEKRDAIYSPATISAESLYDSELCDIEAMPAIFLSPRRHRAKCISPMPFFLGGGDHATWCSPSRVLMAADSPSKDEIGTNRHNNISSADNFEASIAAATPLDLSFDSTHGVELLCRGKSERPGFISATAFDVWNGVGLTIRCIRDNLIVSGIHDDGVFSNSSLAVGDQLISINGKSCNMITTGGQATRILNNLEGIVSVVVATGSGSSFVESTIVKPKVWSSKTGLGIQVLQGTLQILKIDSDGLWSHSLLSERSQVLSINGFPCSQLDGMAAATLIKTSESRVSIVAKTTQAVVVLNEEQEQPTSIPSPTPKPSMLGLKNARTSPPLTFLGPCFQKVWSPAKIAHIAANIVAVLAPVAVCLGFDLGLVMTVGSLLLSVLIVNVPWWGWTQRREALCSVGQVVSTLLVFCCCAVLLPAYHSSSLLLSVIRNAGIALPSTLLANLPMHFTDDGIEHFALNRTPMDDRAPRDEGEGLMEDEMPV